MEFRLLGPLEVCDDGRSLSLGGPKQRALLTMLLLRANEPVSVDELVDALWGPSPPQTASTSLQNCVSRLRKLVGPDALVWRAGAYELRVPPDQIDLGRFDELVARARESFAVGDPRSASTDLTAALALWRGRALADVAFESFVQTEIARLEERRIVAVEERIDAELQLGHHADLVADLEALVSANPLRERLAAQLMLALYRCGRQADALAVYQRTRGTLVEQLGIRPNPALRKLEQAILLQEPALELEPVPEPLASPQHVPDHELRPVTVLFADLVGSTSLAERLTPSEVKALIGECVGRMSSAVEEHGGTIQAYAGAGICAYFGVPAAHEDDPERAARAALRIVEIVAGYARDIRDAWEIPDFAARVGINSGQTAVGVVRSGDPDAVALGDTTNVAARLKASAEPDTISVGEFAARRLEHRFVLESLGEVELGGRAERASAWRLVRPRRQSKPIATAPLIGREREVATLHAAAEDLRAGRGQVLFVIGEAGIGKTRLLAELRAIAGDDVVWLQGNCLSYGGFASWPFVEALQGWLGVETGEADVSARTKARARLGTLLGPRADDVLGPLARLLRIGVDPFREDRSSPPGTAPAQQIREAYAAWIEALAARQPVVLAIEDLHWASSSTRALAESLLASTDRMPLLLVATSRVEPHSEGWTLRVRALAEFAYRTSELSLGPLAAENAATLLRLLAPGALDDEARKTLVARAEGNPLYLEELLRHLVETGGLVRHRTWTLTVSAASLPPALESLLIARIDLLPHSTRRLAQAAAVIGRTFPVHVLQRVVGGEGFSDDLEALLRADVIRETRRRPDFECSFRHGLLQEAAVATLAPDSRRELSGRAAAAFEATESADEPDHWERLAHYYAQSDDPRKAIDYLERAAARANALAGPARAAELLGHAQTLTTRLAPPS
jgi:DNA-binding SARP family transcriptional activator